MNLQNSQNCRNNDVIFQLLWSQFCDTVFTMLSDVASAAMNRYQKRVTIATSRLQLSTDFIHLYLQKLSYKVLITLSGNTSHCFFHIYIICFNRLSVYYSFTFHLFLTFPPSFAMLILNLSTSDYHYFYHNSFTCTTQTKTIKTVICRWDKQHTFILEKINLILKLYINAHTINA